MVRKHKQDQILVFEKLSKTISNLSNGLQSGLQIIIEF